MTDLVKEMNEEVKRIVSSGVDAIQASVIYYVINQMHEQVNKLVSSGAEFVAIEVVQCGRPVNPQARSLDVLFNQNVSALEERNKQLEAALKDPTLDMLIAGKKSLYSCSEDPELDDARKCFKAMVAALGEKKDG